MGLKLKIIAAPLFLSALYLGFIGIKEQAETLQDIAEIGPICVLRFLSAVFHFGQMTCFCYSTYVDNVSYKNIYDDYISCISNQLQYKMVHKIFFIVAIFLVVQNTYDFYFTMFYSKKSSFGLKMEYHIKAGHTAFFLSAKNSTNPDNFNSTDQSYKNESNMTWEYFIGGSHLALAFIETALTDVINFLPGIQAILIFTANQAFISNGKRIANVNLEFLHPVPASTEFQVGLKKLQRFSDTLSNKMGLISGFYFAKFIPIFATFSHPTIIAMNWMTKGCVLGHFIMYFTIMLLGAHTNKTFRSFWRGFLHLENNNLRYKDIININTLLNNCLVGLNAGGFFLVSFGTIGQALVLMVGYTVIVLQTAKNFELPLP